MSTRRVVTGVDDDGRAVFVRDELVETTTLSFAPEGLGFDKVWGVDALRSPSDGSALDYSSMFPPAGGVRYEVISFPPVGAARSEVAEEAMAAEMDEKVPGLREALGADGFHVTSSIDIGIVLEGEIVLELDDGEERTLYAGDVFVQNGTNHAWRNRSDSIARMAVVLIGAKRGD